MCLTARSQQVYNSMVWKFPYWHHVPVEVFIEWGTPNHPRIVPFHWKTLSFGVPNVEKCRFPTDTWGTVSGLQGAPILNYTALGILPFFH